MDIIKALITKFTEQLTTGIMPVLLIGVLAIGGLLVMLNNHREGKSWIVNGLIGAAIILGAPTIAALVH